MELETMKTLMEEFKEKNVQMLERILQHVTEKDAKIAEKDQRIAELIKTSETKEQKINELKQILRDAQKSLSNSVDVNSHLISLQKTENAKLQDEISECDKLISDLTEDAKNSKEENEALKAEIFQFKNSNREKQKVIDQQAKRILELEAEIKEKTFEIDGLINGNYKIVIEKVKQITELKQEIETCKKEVETDLQQKHKIIDLQDQIIAGNQYKITVLEEQNIQLQEIVKEKEEIIDGQAYMIEEEEIEKIKILNAYEKEKSQLKKEIAALKMRKTPDPMSVYSAFKKRMDGEDFDLFVGRTQKKRNRTIISSDEDDDFFV